MTPVRSIVRRAAPLLVPLVVTSALSTSVARAQDTTSAIHYKGLTLSPVGFAAAEAVYRTRNIAADIGASYNAIPFDGTSARQLSEFRATGRQSRIGILATRKANDNSLTGFWEADFLGVGPAQTPTRATATSFGSASIGAP